MLKNLGPNWTQVITFDSNDAKSDDSIGSNSEDRHGSGLAKAQIARP